MEDRHVAALYLSPVELDIKDRLVAGYTYWIENPTMADSKIVEFIRNTFNISIRQAYADVESIRRMLGNIRNAHKEWNRFVVIEMCKQAFEMAKNEKDAKGMASAADKLGKYTRCDQVDEDQLPWDQLIPPNFEPSTDVTILGFKHDPHLDQKRKALRRKYMPEEEITDAEILD